ncbi:MAG: outer membrane lipoprotein carrier protein LolA [Lentimicrobiaceae bacterium]|nr:outer membrane lipoprotein carrier protein LolA [Lentimicrobiaceae bacterium]
MKNILSVIMCVSMFSAFAQPSQMVSKKHNDPEATAILNELQTKLNSYTSISIDFAFQSEKDDKITDEMQGNIKVKGTKYVLFTQIQRVFCDGVTVWNFLPEQKEVSLSNYSEDDDSQMINPLSLVKNYAKQYKANFIKEALNKGIMEQTIDLIPLKASSFYKIRLIIDKNKKQITRITLYEKDNTQYTYVVTKFQTNQPMDDKNFVFDTAKYPDVEVIDMR